MHEYNSSSLPFFHCSQVKRSDTSTIRFYKQCWSFWWHINLIEDLNQQCLFTHASSPISSGRRYIWLLKYPFRLTSRFEAPWNGVSQSGVNSTWELGFPATGFSNSSLTLGGSLWMTFQSLFPNYINTTLFICKTMFCLCSKLKAESFNQITSDEVVIPLLW